VVEHRLGRAAGMWNGYSGIYIVPPFASPAEQDKSTRGKNGSMSGRRKLFELTVLGGAACILSGALLALIVGTGRTPLDGNAAWRLIRAISYLGVAVVLAPWYRETLFVLRRNWSLVSLLVLAVLQERAPPMTAPTNRPVRHRFDVVPGPREYPAPIGPRAAGLGSAGTRTVQHPATRAGRSRFSAGRATAAPRSAQAWQCS